MTNPKYVDILSFKVFSDDLNLIPINDKRGKVINTISPNSYGISLQDHAFRKALAETDYLVLDGVYFALASLLLKGKNIRRNQGPDVFYHFMNRVNRFGGKVFFLGSTEETLLRITERATREYKNISSRNYSPPFKKEFSQSDSQIMVDSINNFSPDILFIGMTCPKQEKWAINYRADVNAGLIISIGNVFDWYAGTQKSIHPFWFKIRLGWLVRIFYRPEIFKRNIKNQTKFFRDILLMFLRLKKVT
jgi:N-acetylglucosaminyldiphosphoundecaprenol N-acetyl-beta-D-mannosaminyltransferase